MVACELEAAKALAEMASFSVVRGGASMSRLQHAVVASQDQPVAAESTAIASPEKIGEHIPKQLCTSVSLNPPMKFRRKLTEAEKEERKIRRVMANRESARETIRRRQVMHLELIRKAEDVLEESEDLKKQKELMVEEYNSLKGRNGFLKAQLARSKKAATGEESERNSSDPDRFRSTTTATTSISLQTQPSEVPCLCPYMVPSSDAFPFQGAFHLPCPNQGQGFSTEIPRQGVPLFIVHVPWLLPLLTQDKPHTHHCGKSPCSGDVPSSQNMRADHLSQTMIVPGVFWPLRPRETVEAPRSEGVVTCPRKKAEDVFAAAEARRRRKELMKLKNVHNNNAC